MKYLLDSNALIYAARSEALYLPFRSWANRPDVTVSAISQVEQPAVQIRQQFRLKTPDAIIAATALEHDLTLVTADTGFVRVAGLTLIDPLAS